MIGTKGCILRFDAVHVPRKTRRRAKRYRLSVGSAFDEVIDGCIEQHGESWLYPPIRSLLTSLSDGVVVPEHAASSMVLIAPCFIVVSHYNVWWGYSHTIHY